MSDGHTPLNGQDGLSYDFAEIPSKYDDPAQKPRYVKGSTPEIFDAENSDDIIADHPEHDAYHPEDFDSDAFSDATFDAPAEGARRAEGVEGVKGIETTIGTADSTPQSSREIGSVALNKSHQTLNKSHQTRADRDHSFDAAAEFARISEARHPRGGSASISNRFRAQQADGMPLPTKFDSSIVNLPPPGVIPDPSEVILPTEARPDYPLDDNLNSTNFDAANTSTNSAPEYATTPENSLVNPENPLDNPEATVTPERPLESSKNSRHRQNRNSLVTKLNPLTTASDAEDKFQGEKGHLGGRAKQELRDGQHALDQGDTESAYRYFRNAMAGFVGEYHNRNAQDFQERMWKEHPKKEATQK